MLRDFAFAASRRVPGSAWESEDGETELSRHGAEVFDHWPGNNRFTHTELCIRAEVPLSWVW
jgi:hypothetical protein